MQTAAVSSVTFSSHNFQDFVDKIAQSSHKLALVLLDIDDTSIFSGSPDVNYLGGLKWRDLSRKMIDTLKKEGLIGQNDQIFENITLFISLIVYLAAVETLIPDAVKNLKSKYRCHVMAFTARGSSGLKAWYNKEIAGVAELTASQFSRARIELSYIGKEILHPNVYNNAYIFCQNEPKEKILEDLIDKKVVDLNEVDLIAYADDKSVLEVEKVAKKHNVNFIGFNYTAVVQREAKEFDLLKSTLQLLRLFEKGVVLPQSEVQVRSSEVLMAGITPEDHFKAALIQLNDKFKTHGLYRKFETVQEYFSAVIATIKY